MKTFRRILALILASMMIVFVLPLGVIAQGVREGETLVPSYAAASAIPTATTVSSVGLKRGDTVTVTMSITADCYHSCLGVDFSEAFDPAVFEVADAQWLLSGALLSDIDFENRLAAVAYVNDVNMRGDVFRLTLKVKPHAPVGSTNIVTCLSGGTGISFSDSFATVTVKDRPAAPDAPIVKSYTSDSVTLVETDGMEYSMDGVTWQASPIFNGLTVGTEYTFYQRLAETDLNLASEASSALSFRIYDTDIRSDQSVLSAGDTATVTVSIENDFIQYSLGVDFSEAFDPAVFEVVDAKWLLSGALLSDVDFENCLAAIAYANRVNMRGDVFELVLKVKEGAPIGNADITVSIVGENAVNVSFEKPSVTVAVKKRPSAPAAPAMASRTDTAVTLVKVDGAEYSMDGKTWQASPVFEGLSPATEYTFYQRLAETDATCVSPSSEPSIIVTDKSKPAAPAAPAFESVTDTTVTLVKVDGAEYSMDGKTWQASPVFEGLSPATEYTFCQRLVETATCYESPVSEFASIFTDKSHQAAPAAPAFESVTDTTVTLVKVDGAEYSVDGKTWQASPVFEGLSPATEYVFYQRLAETATHYASPLNAVTVVTDKSKPAAPAAPTMASRTDTTVTLVKVDGAEYSMDGKTWQASPVFEGLSPATEYTFCQRLVETATCYESPVSEFASIFTDKSHQAAPGAPAFASRTETSVTLTEQEGMQYSLDKKNWQSTPLFTDLQRGTVYTFYQRYAETKTQHASPASRGAIFGTVNPQPQFLIRSSESTISHGDSVTFVISFAEPVTSAAFSIDFMEAWDDDAFEWVEGGWLLKDAALSGVDPSNYAAVIAFTTAKEVSGDVFTFTLKVKNGARVSPFLVTSLITFAGGAVGVADMQVNVKNKVEAPAAPIIASCTDTTVTLVKVDGAEYSMDGKTWQASPVFEGLSPATEYTFYQRLAETDVNCVSSASEPSIIVTDKSKPAAPAAPTCESVTDTTVTLVKVDGAEYSMDGVTWQASPVFEGLADGTEYTFYQRLVETDTQHASPASVGLTVKTVEKPKYLLGDVDNDGVVAAADAIYLLYHTLLGEQRYPLNQPAEFNKDGKVDAADAIYLLYHTLLGEGRYPLV